MLDGFIKLQQDGLFPKNADIRAEEDFLYLYPELDNGKWVDRRSQFLYAICRFGNSRIDKVEWTTDNPELAEVDENGVVTAKSQGEVTVICRITDEAGNVNEARKTVTLTDQIISEVKEVNDGAPGTYPKGVYNMQGVRLGDSTDNLPPGLYIADGKKVMIK